MNSASKSRSIGLLRRFLDGKKLCAASARKIAAMFKATPSSSLKRSLIAIWVVIAFGSAALISMAAWSMRDHEVRRGQQINDALATALEELTSSYFLAAETALSAASTLFDQARIAGRLDVENARGLLRSVLVNRSLIRSIWY